VQAADISSSHPPLGFATGVATQQPLEGGIEIEGQLSVVRAAGRRQRAYYHKATGGQQVQTFPHKVTQATPDQVALDRVADGFAHDETRTRRGTPSPWRVRVHGVAAQMDDQQRATRAASTAHRFTEVLAPPQPILGGQHGMRPEAIRRTGGRGPCHGGTR
jgi:hypothetical protein